MDYEPETKPSPFPLPPQRGDHADGIYFRMPEEDYHADTALGASGICDLLQSPLKFWMNSAFNPKKVAEDKDDKETAATIRGNLFHDLMAAGRSSIVRKPDGMSFATKEGKAFKEERPGATFISGKDFDKVQLMIDALRETGALERVGGMGGGINEVSFFWTDKMGRRRKMRADRLFNGEMFDWKTMANAMSKDVETLTANTVAQFKYHIKAFWYQVGIQAMKSMIAAKGAKAFMSETSEKEFAEMKALADTETIVPFWYIFIEASGVPNIVARRFVSHEGSELNAYFRAAKQETERALNVYTDFMTSHGADKPWHPAVHFKEFTDSDFSAARWILAED